MESENLEKYQDISKLLKVTKTGDKVKVSILFKEVFVKLRYHSF